MRPLLSLPVRLTMLFLLIGLAALWAVPMSSHACCPATRCAWQRTFYAYNALDYPLPPYYIPRTPGCIRGEYVGGQASGVSGCAGGQAAGRWNYSPQAGIGLEPVELERLGRVPNDMAPLNLTSEGAGPSRGR